MKVQQFFARKGLLTCFLILEIFFSITTGQQSGFVIATDSTAIYYRTFGSGKPLLIINGGPGMNSDGFEGLAVALSENFRTILFDQRGTGKSKVRSMDSVSITMDKMIADIESIRKQMGYQQWSVLGHSFGGMVASAYAGAHPEVIDKIVLSASGGIDLDLLNYFSESLHAKLSQQQIDSIEFWAAKMGEDEAGRYARLQRAKILSHAYVYDSTYWPAIADRLTQINPEVNQLMWDDLHRIGFDCKPKLKSVHILVLIIQGKQDIVRAETAEKSHKAFHHSKLVYMDHCIHYGWLDNPDVYFSEVVGFLRT